MPATFGIVVDPTGAITGSRAAKRAIESVGTQATVTQRKADAAFKKLGATITLTFATTAVIQFFRTALRELNSFETGLVGVAKTTGLTNVQLAEMEQRVDAMTRRMPVAAESVLSVAQAAGQLGVTGLDNIEKFTETILRLEKSSDLVGDTAAIALARILNVTGTGVENIDRLGAAIVGLGNDAAATESEITHMANRVSLTIGRFGVPVAEVVGLATAMKEMGLRAELAGSAVGRVFNEINAAVAEGGENLEVFARVAGQTTEAFAQNFRADSMEAFLAFLNGLNVAGPDASVILDRIGLSGVETTTVMGTLANRIELVSRRVEQGNTLYAENTALLEESNRAFDTGASRVTMFVEALNRVVRAYGEGLKPTFEAILSFFTRMANHIEDLIRDFQRIQPNLIAGALLRDEAVTRIRTAAGLNDPDIGRAERMKRRAAHMRSGAESAQNIELMMRTILQERMDERQRVIDAVISGHIPGGLGGANPEPLPEGGREVDTAFRESIENLIKESADANREMKDDQNMILSQMENRFEEFGNALVTDFSSIGGAFKSLVANMLKDWANMILKMTVFKPLTNALGGFVSGIFGGLPGFGGGGGRPSQIGVPVSTPPFIGSIAHTGGVIGQDRMRAASVHPGMFANAPIFHQGGVVGTPVIAQRGEGIFTEAQMRNLAPVGRGGNIKIETNIRVDQSGATIEGTKAEAEETGRRLNRAVNEVVNRRIIEASQPGGVINRAIFATQGR